MLVFPPNSTDAPNKVQFSMVANVQWCWVLAECYYLLLRMLGGYASHENEEMRKNERKKECRWVIRSVLRNARTSLIFKFVSMFFFFLFPFHFPTKRSPFDCLSCWKWKSSIQRCLRCGRIHALTLLATRTMKQKIKIIPIADRPLRSQLRVCTTCVHCPQLYIGR